MAGAPKDHHDSDYVPGTMDVSEQASTYSLVMNIVKWGSLITAVTVLILVLWFKPDGSFFAGVIAGAVLAVAGWFMLRSKPPAH